MSRPSTEGKTPRSAGCGRESAGGDRQLGDAQTVLDIMRRRSSIVDQ
ncbi:hypothetical protein [Leucobacter manosquensis]|nr:hypothetical protein [Leucobacter manosquensis]